MSKDIDIIMMIIPIGWTYLGGHCQQQPQIDRHCFDCQYNCLGHHHHGDHDHHDDDHIDDADHPDDHCIVDWEVGHCQQPYDGRWRRAANTSLRVLQCLVFIVITCLDGTYF